MWGLRRERAQIESSLPETSCRQLATTTARPWRGRCRPAQAGGTTADAYASKHGPDALRGVCGWGILDAPRQRTSGCTATISNPLGDVKQTAMSRTWVMEERRSGTFRLWLPPGGCKAPALVFKFGRPRGGHRVAGRVFMSGAHNDDAETVSGRCRTRIAGPHEAGREGSTSTSRVLGRNLPPINRAASSGRDTGWPWA